MANKVMTVFQHLDKAISGNWDMVKEPTSHINSYNMSNADANKVIYKTDNKEDYAKTKLELQQNAYLNQRWQKANVDLSVQAFNGLNNVKLMYRDAELMDSFPEIGAALDIISEESCFVGQSGKLINIYSNSDRIKNVLEDLFMNRLDITVTAPMIIRAMCKYGNQFMMLNIDNKIGITGWRQLPVFNVERLENGIINPYSTTSVGLNGTADSDMTTKFVWTDETNTQVPFRNWQIGHFRLLTNSLYLPYGVSYLNNARRHWRMLSLMEDMMLIYRLERSVERRVYKIYVGAIDDADVKAYVEDIANNFKRTPIVDPMTGQIDLRKNILPVHKDTPIPLLDGRTISIKELAKEYNEGKENYVYSIQDKTHQIVPGKVVWCGKNYTADELVKITLDDDTYCIMAKEHELIMRDGSKKRADNVSIGESVMPFYRKNNYEQVYNPHSGKYEFTHDLFNANNKYNTSDLTEEIWNDIRIGIINKIINMPIDLLKFINHSTKVNVDIHFIYRLLKKKGFKSVKDFINEIRKNHKIKKIELVKGDDVYCMTVVGLNGEEDRHNFAIQTWKENGEICVNGCFISNCVDQDIFIPVRDQNAPTPIDTLSAGQNLTAMDDIKFVQNKVCTALRIPKAFLNFEQEVGDGKNLSLMDVRFMRTVNRIQQAFLMELTKIASIHLYLLGFEDELTNFSLSMNNPSSQAEQLEIEVTAKKIGAIRDAVADPGNGIPIMSLSRALKEIMKWSDKEIQENLEEIRLEKGIAAELEKTTQIIKKTGIFDTVDRIYGEPGAEYQDDQGGQGQGDEGGMGAPGGGGGFGGGLDDLGAPGGDEAGDLVGEEGEMPLGSEGGPEGGAPEPPSGGEEGGAPEPPMESRYSSKPLITENQHAKALFDNYLTHFKHEKNESLVERAEIYDKTMLINEDFNKMINSLGDYFDDKD